MRFPLFYLLILLSSSMALGQDVVRMKSGNVYRGQVLEQRFNQYIQIRLSDGNEKRLNWQEIQDIGKEEVPQPVAVTINKPQILKRNRLATVGMITFLSSYGATILGTAFFSYRSVAGEFVSYSLIPVVGPLLMLGHEEKREGFDGLLIASSLVQALTATLWIIGEVQGPVLAISTIPDEPKSLYASLRISF